MERRVPEKQHGSLSSLLKKQKNGEEIVFPWSVIRERLVASLPFVHRPHWVSATPDPDYHTWVQSMRLLTPRSGVRPLWELKSTVRFVSRRGLILPAPDEK